MAFLPGLLTALPGVVSTIGGAIKRVVERPEGQSIGEALLGAAPEAVSGLASAAGSFLPGTAGEIARGVASAADALPVISPGGRIDGVDPSQFPAFMALGDQLIDRATNLHIDPKRGVIGWEGSYPEEMKTIEDIAETYGSEGGVPGSWLDRAANLAGAENTDIRTILRRGIDALGPKIIPPAQLLAPPMIASGPIPRTGGIMAPMPSEARAMPSVYDRMRPATIPGPEGYAPRLDFWSRQMGPSAAPAPTMPQVAPPRQRAQPQPRYKKVVRRQAPRRR